MSKVVNLEDVAHPRIAVMYRSKFNHIPPTLFIVAECDPLRDDSYGLSLCIVALIMWPH